MISSMNLLKSPPDCISLCRQTKQLDGIHGYNRPKTRKGELNKCLCMLIWECRRLLLVISLPCIKYFIKGYKNMNNNYLTVWRIPGGYKIRAKMEINPNRYHSMKYYDYSKREAIRQYRQQFGLVGKHLQLIEI